MFGTPTSGTFLAEAESEGQQILSVDQMAYTVKYEFAYEGGYPQLCYSFQVEPVWIHSVMPDPEAEPFIPGKQVVLNWKNSSSTDIVVDYILTPVLAPDPDPEPSDTQPYTYSPCGDHDPEE